jgi:hypothetical protein
MEDEEQHEENENRAPPTPLNPERSGCSPEVVRTSSPLRRRELSGLKTTPIWMISTRWILVLQLIRFRNDPQVQFFLNEPFLANYPAILRIRATSGHALGILRDPNQPGGLQPPEPIRAPRAKNPPPGLRRLRGPADTPRPSDQRASAGPSPVSARLRTRPAGSVLPQRSVPRVLGNDCTRAYRRP